LALFSALPDAHLGLNSRSASDGSAPNSTCMGLKATFSGSTRIDRITPFLLLVACFLMVRAQ